MPELEGEQGKGMAGHLSQVAPEQSMDSRAIYALFCVDSWLRDPRNGIDRQALYE